MYTGRRGIWPLKRPRPGAASRGKGYLCWIRKKWKGKPYIRPAQRDILIVYK